MSPIVQPELIIFLRLPLNSLSHKPFALGWEKSRFDSKSTQCWNFQFFLGLLQWQILEQSWWLGLLTKITLPLVEPCPPSSGNGNLGNSQI